MRFTRTIKRTREQLLTLQEAVGVSVYSRSIQSGLFERTFYLLMNALFLFVFIVASIFYINDAYDRRYLLFQSCEPYAETAPSDEKVACPGGKYPLPYEKQGACPIRFSSDEKSL